MCGRATRGQYLPVRGGPVAVSALAGMGVRADAVGGRTMRHVLLVMLVMALIAVGGCAGLSPTEQTTLTGGAAGAASGALVGAIAGNAGLLGGFLYGEHQQSVHNAYERGVQEGYQRAQQW
jgi:osmotically inducible lipoprotein OsmB